MTDRSLRRQTTSLLEVVVKMADSGDTPLKFFNTSNRKLKEEMDKNVDSLKKQEAEEGVESSVTAGLAEQEEDLDFFGDALSNTASFSKMGSFENDQHKLAHNVALRRSTSPDTFMRSLQPRPSSLLESFTGKGANMSPPRRNISDIQSLCLIPLSMKESSDCLIRTPEDRGSHLISPPHSASPSVSFVSSTSVSSQNSWKSAPIRSPIMDPRSDVIRSPIMDPKLGGLALPLVSHSDPTPINPIKKPPRNAKDKKKNDSQLKMPMDGSKAVKFKRMSEE